MGIFEAILLGIIQGLTEFLPISSSAHLRIASELLGIGDAGAAFTAITQIGTEAAVIVFFWRDIVRIIGRWFGSLTGRVARKDPDALMGWWIIVGTLPIVVLGLLFQDQIETTLRSLWFVAISLIVFGLLLGVADRVGRNARPLEQLTWKHGLVYGFAQALALIPGVSRSGGTITAGLFMGYRREAAARYSFLLAIPAVLGSGFYQVFKAVRAPEGQTPMGLTLVATLVAFVVALFVIGLFMKYISKRSFLPFVVYRVLLGIAIIVLLSAGVLTPEGGVAAATATTGGSL
ncbi:undecaprenyl-diphosphate phosphatase [Leucobacter allii]|uniref:Undecaprenyl-diphosphatase n=1 Tax=Leucobacter allii TaxID=2932247 RepID=A0ABY4FQ78_9MICO|nr:undecaprenyl-diphosphate phosphatase [Leucobacter allii]UOQ58440.1 undecaprenyl-diphosphate phosphatase [Leucobacter allii]UOR03021.1 undecaprenyl-diphosphate phosphatase [Leucobacter allii]